MKRAKLEALSLVGYHVLGSLDETVEVVAHEVAHAVLLFGRVRADGARLITERIGDARSGGMSNTRANDHEIKTCALEIAGLRKLGYRVNRRELAESAYAGFGGRARTRRFLSAAAVERAICAERPSRRNINRFVAAYKLFERML